MSVVNVSIDLQEPHPGQQKILDGSKRFNHLRCGRRLGKTTLIGELSEIVIDGKFVGIWFPTYKDLDPVWQEMKQIFKPIIKSKNEVLHQITMFTGGLIDFWSMENPDSGQGRKYHRAIVDEAAKSPNLYRAWENTIRPTLTDYIGDAYIMSRPKGKNNPFYLIEEKHKGFDNWAFFHLTSYDNCTDVGGYLERTEIEEAKNQLDDINFRQEYLAEYVDANDRPFLYAWDEKKHVIDSYQPNKHLPLLLSWDFNREPMTCLICQQTDMWTLYIFEEIDMDGSTPEVCEKVLADYQQWIYNIEVTGDATGRNRSALVKGNLNHYRIMKDMLSLTDDQIRVPTQNLALSDSRVLCNSVLKNANLKITKNCKKTIKDAAMAMVDDEGDLIKNGTYPLHKFDGLRYSIACCFTDFIKYPDRYR